MEVVASRAPALQLRTRRVPFRICNKNSSIIMCPVSICRQAVSNWRSWSGLTQRSLAMVRPWRTVSLLFGWNSNAKTTSSSVTASDRGRGGAPKRNSSPQQNVPSSGWIRTCPTAKTNGRTLSAPHACVARGSFVGHGVGLSGASGSLEASPRATGASPVLAVGVWVFIIMTWPAFCKLVQTDEGRADVHTCKATNAGATIGWSPESVLSTSGVRYTTNQCLGVQNTVWKASPRVQRSSGA